jgi:hypothetical protein
VFSFVSRPLGEKLAATAEKLANGLHFLARGRDAGSFFLETSFYWGLNVLGMWLLAWGCHVVHADGSAMTLGETCTLMGMLGCSILFPSGPLLMGVFQFGLYAAMVMYVPEGVVNGAGKAYVFLLWSIQVVWTVAGAAFFLFIDRSSRKALAESPALSNTPVIMSEHPPAQAERG